MEWDLPNVLLQLLENTLTMSYRAQEFYSLKKDELSHLAPLFESAFHTSFPLPLMEWKYAPDHGESWIDGEIDQIQFHCGILWRSISYFGRTVVGGQLIDLMSAKSARKTSRKDTSFYRLTAHLLNTIIPQKTHFTLAYGMPSQRAMRLGQHLNLYAAVGRIHEIRMSPKKSFGGLYRLKELHPNDALFDVRINQLWHDMRNDCQDLVLAVRDSKAIRQRYCLHPSEKYHLLECTNRITGKPLGLAVISHQAGLHIHDLIAPVSNIPNVLSALCNWAHVKGLSHVEMLGSERVRRSLQRIKHQSIPTEFEIMANPYMEPSALARIHDHWWFTSGDTDYL